MKTAFPYRVLSGDVRLQVDRVYVDNVAVGLDGRVNDGDKVVTVNDLNETNEHWSELRLAVSVTAADQAELFAGPWSQVSCIAVARNRKTNVYHSFALVPDGTGKWHGEVEVRREDHIGRSQIDARLVATVNKVEGRLIGEAQPWIIDFEAKRPTPERSLRMRWIDFTEHDHLKEYRDDPWLLDIEVGEPILYLNSAVDGLRGILEQAATPEQKMVQEVLSSQVAAEAWSALFSASVYACRTGDDDQWPGGWQEDVLRRMLPDLYPNVPPDQALAELIEARREGENGSDLQRRLIHAAGVQSRKPRKISTVLRDLRRMANKKESV